MSVAGLFLMVAPVAWLCWLVLTQDDAGHIRLDLVHLVIAGLCWMAGRVLAGKSLLDFFLS